MNTPTPNPKAPESLTEAITQAINRFSAENGSDTPDFILGKYLSACLDAWNSATKERDRWYGHKTLTSGITSPEGIPTPEQP